MTAVAPVIAVAWVQFLAQEISHAVGVAKKGGTDTNKFWQLEFTYIANGNVKWF